MEPATSAIGLVDASLKLLSTLHKFCRTHYKVPHSVTSIQADLEYIEEAIRTGSDGSADRSGTRSWLNDLRRIKLRIEDVDELYNSEYAGHNGSFEGLLGTTAEKIQDTVKRMFGPGSVIVRYLKEIEDLSAAAKRRADTYYRSGGTASETTRNKKEDFYHDNEAVPVGLETPVKDLLQMLRVRDAALLRVVAIVGPDTSSGSKLAKAAFEKVQAKEEFACKVWVTASHDDDGKGLLKDILDGLGQRRQGEQLSTHQLIDIVKCQLEEKRYIIGIDTLDATRYWDAVLNAFPDDAMSSRIIITTRQEDMAQTCHKNCSVFPEEADEVEIIKILCEGTARKRRVVTVSGPGGSGKSVLARAVYKQVEEGFLYKAWGMASHADAKDLLLDILRQLGKTGLQENKFLELTDILRDLLLNGRYIIVIDGLETIKDWNNVLDACPDNNRSSRIIVTTTSTEVASICERDGPIYKMEPLDERYAKDLLVRKVSTEDGCAELTDKMINMILKTCEYLPLAISNMGDYMRSSKLKLEYAECANVCVNVGSLFADNVSFKGMNHVLSRSHSRLDDNAKACLLSLSIYSKNLIINDHEIVDNPIKAKPLIRRLLAERLISQVEGSADKCFTQLIEHNFIVPLKFSISGQLKTFRINRMMPQFINSKGAYENYVTRIDTQQGNAVESYTDITRLCLHNGSTESPWVGEKAGMSHVRLLIFSGHANEALMDFNDYPFLRVLILEKCGNMKDEHLNTIFRSRKILRYLSIRDSIEVTMLPNNIVNMQSLETLDTRGTSVHQITLDVILLLPKLLHLFGEFQITCANPKEKSVRQKLLSMVVPQNNKIAIIENSKLKTLAGFLIDESSDFVKLLPRMRMLSKVRILCRKDPRKEVTDDLQESLKCCFGKKDRNPSYHSLSIDFHGYDLNFLDDFKIESPCSLVSLKVCGKLTKLPQFLVSFSDSLKELCLSVTSLWETILLELQQLKTLQFLKIHRFEFNGQLIFQSSWFGSLQRLCFDVETVPEIVIQQNAMVGLMSLQLLCNELDGISGILHLHQLKEVILPSKVSGKGAEDLLLQVSKHSKKPKFLDSDGSRRQISKFSIRKLGFKKEEVEKGPRLSRTDGFRKPEDKKESDGDGSSLRLDL